VFAFHRPETLAAFLQYLPAAGASAATGAIHTGPATPPTVDFGASTFLARLQDMPPLIEEGLWPAQIKAIRNLEAIPARPTSRAR
jgi:type I restriction enzyme R subunit